MQIKIISRKEEVIENAKPISNLEELKDAKRVFYELNDNWGNTWLGIYKEVELRGAVNFYEHFKGYIDDWGFTKEKLEKHFNYHRFKYTL